MGILIDTEDVGKIQLQTLVKFLKLKYFIKICYL